MVSSAWACKCLRHQLERTRSSGIQLICRKEARHECPDTSLLYTFSFRIPQLNALCQSHVLFTYHQLGTNTLLSRVNNRLGSYCCCTVLHCYHCTAAVVVLTPGTRVSFPPLDRVPHWIRLPIGPGSPLDSPLDRSIDRSIDLYKPVVFACFLLGEWLVPIDTSFNRSIQRFNTGNSDCEKPSVLNLDSKIAGFSKLEILRRNWGKDSLILMNAPSFRANLPPKGKNLPLDDKCIG